jgi:hypothetical protein
MELLDEVLGAYGGVDRWREAETITIHQKIGGVLWHLKGVGGILDDSTVRITLREQRAWHTPLPRAGFRSAYTPQLVQIETDGAEPEVIDKLALPRQSFTSHTLETPWSHLQLAYFAGYAMWTYLSEPFSLTLPGVHTEELGAWQEDGQTWRRLAVQYPESIATHSSDQTLYVDSDGLIRRRDYQVDIADGSPAAHYSDGHREFDGIVLPVQRVANPRDDRGHRIPEVTTVTIDIDQVRVD